MVTLAPVVWEVWVQEVGFTSFRERSARPVHGFR